MYMSKKNKRRWNRRHEFQWHKKTESRKGHPSYIFGSSGKKFRFFCFTHSDTTDGAENIKLKHNIDKNDNRDCYIRPVAQVDNRDNFEPARKKYELHKEDKSLIAKLLDMFR